MEVLKISPTSRKAPKPWLQEALSRGRKFAVKTKKRVRVNDRAAFKKEV